MGTPGFAVESLKALVEGAYNVVAVVTVPDKPAGRGQKVRMSEVKQYALEHDLPVLQPEKLKTPEFVEALRSFKADLQIVVAFRMLPEIVWAMPKMGTFNLHGSLLPNYRGAAPLNWALINGDKKTGVTTFLLKHEIDTGNLLFQESIDIDLYDNVGTVHDKLMVIGASLVCKTVDALASGDVAPMDQDKMIAEGAVSNHAPKIFKADCQVSSGLSVMDFHNKVRGLSPYPAAWIALNDGDKKYTAKLFSTIPSVESHTDPIGQVVQDKDMLRVSLKDGYVWFEEMQLAGKKRMKTVQFINGFRIEKELILA
ncbi:methionyl-tRNA formyltransferase [Halosquirtibacter laminarini]|uniref:Methionyl-tRNA formyltransferase n=2 Tax=Halosquirtibacter laminarini TaxID=3374600 RepID=A0AC61NJU8_9BACT|nr:methionyl-tRNA formyltransferase [Prolixibacteraceae bacterium]